MRRNVVPVVCVLFIGGCTCTAYVGEPCDNQQVCAENLTCVDGYCQVEARTLEKMAKQSGVAMTGEASDSPAGPGSVRVRKASGTNLAAAMCSSDERLIGGWCDPPAVGGGDNTHVVDQAAGGYTRSDTIGAHWKCSLDRDRQLTAFAMCQKLPTDPKDEPGAPPQLTRPVETNHE